MVELRRPRKSLRHVRKHVIFVHGLDGEQFATWQSKTSPPEFWPDWLEEEKGASIGVWALGYPAPSSWWRKGPAMALPDRAQNILQSLQVGLKSTSGDIYFVAHSLGGLVIEQMLRVLETQSLHDQNFADFQRRIKGLVLVGTPHTGSRFSNLSGMLRLIVRPKATTQGLMQEDPFLRDLNHWFRGFVAENKFATLVLRESLPLPYLSFLGKVVEPSSADPGLGPATRVVPLDEDHISLVKPKGRHADVYKYVLDFLTQPNTTEYRDQLVTDGITDVRNTLDARADELLTGQQEILNILRPEEGAVSESLVVENTVVGKEVLRRLEVVRKLRFTSNFETNLEVRRLATSLNSGELSSAPAEMKRQALAWCARLIARDDIEKAKDYLGRANLIDTGVENAIAAAFVIYFATNDLEATLNRFAEIGSDVARTASLLIVSYEMDKESAISWFDSTGWAFSDLDAEGKLSLMHLHLNAGSWKELESFATEVTDSDMAECPAIMETTAITLMSVAVHETLRGSVFNNLPLDLVEFPLSDAPEAIEKRRQAIVIFDRATAAMASLGNRRFSNRSSDFSLWLRLRDETTKSEALSELETSMSDPSHSLRRVSFALQFGLDVDKEAIERKINEDTARSGGQSYEAAIARMSMAQDKRKPAEVATYIAQHRTQLTKFFDSNWLLLIEISALAHAGDVPGASKRLEEERSTGLSQELDDRLEGIIQQADNDDPAILTEEKYQISRELSDLIELVMLLRARKEWSKLSVYAGILFHELGDQANAELYVEALVETEKYREVLTFGNENAELVDRSPTLRQNVAWAAFLDGDLLEANRRLTRNNGIDGDQGDRFLEMNLAIASGDWMSVNSIVEKEFQNQEQRTAIELLRIAQLAQYVGSNRTKELVRLATERADGDAGVFAGAYSIAISGGWEEEEIVQEWLDEAIRNSGEDGPIQKVDMQTLLDQQPDWNEQQAQTNDELSAGKLPMFGAAVRLRCSLLDLSLVTALSNSAEADPRARKLIPAYAGTRQPTKIDSHIVTLDVTAILTLGFLGLLERTIRFFKQVTIPHSTLRWFLEERQRIQFHQPSQVAAAMETKRLLDTGALKRFESTSGVPTSLEREVGTDLARFLVDAKSKYNEDGTRRVVVRPFPIHRPTSLMREHANTTGYEEHLSGCSNLVVALREAGQITATVAENALEYLAVREQSWPSPSEIVSGTVLYLDDVSVSYLRKLKLLDKLRPAGFDAIISPSEVSTGDALVHHENFSIQAQEIIEAVRATLAKGVANGKVRLGALPKFDKDVDQPISSHPSALVLSAFEKADAIVVDDRAINQHLMIDGSNGGGSVYTTLDLLNTLCAEDEISYPEKQDHLTKLRQAGFFLVPLEKKELVSYLTVAQVRDGHLVETAELRAIRESITRVRCSDVLQMPKESAWFNGNLMVLVSALRSQWTNDIADEVAQARCDWLLSVTDIRGWFHRIGDYLADPNERYLAQTMLLLMLNDVGENERQRYWSWLETRVLLPMKEENGALFDQLVETVQSMIVSNAENVEMSGAEN